VRLGTAFIEHDNKKIVFWASLPASCYWNRLWIHNSSLNRYRCKIVSLWETT